MIGPILSAAGAPKLIGVAVAGLAIAGLAGWGYVEHARVAARDVTIAEQRGQLDQIQAANASLTSTLDALKAQHAREMAALTEAAATAQKRAAQTQRTIQVIRNAPASDDAPVAPVLRGALDGLRRPGAAPGRSDAGGAAGGP